jgi:hypothetical protein
MLDKKMFAGDGTGTGLKFIFVPIDQLEET